MQNWRKLAKERTVRGGYNRGLEDAREAITRMFQDIGDREFNGRTAAALCRQCSVS